MVFECLADRLIGYQLVGRFLLCESGIQDLGFNLGLAPLYTRRISCANLAVFDDI